LISESELAGGQMTPSERASRSLKLSGGAPLGCGAEAGGGVSVGPGGGVDGAQGVGPGVAGKRGTCADASVAVAIHRPSIATPASRPIRVRFTRYPIEE
jgi:hypothetical protein